MGEDRQQPKMLTHIVVYVSGCFWVAAAYPFCLPTAYAKSVWRSPTPIVLKKCKRIVNCRSAYSSATIETLSTYEHNSIENYVYKRKITGNMGLGRSVQH